jgi:hypothetical protein
MKCGWMDDMEECGKIIHIQVLVQISHTQIRFHLPKLETEVSFGVAKTEPECSEPHGPRKTSRDVEGSCFMCLLTFWHRVNLT